MNRSGLRLMLVEDEIIIAMQVRRNLEDHGYRVYDPVMTGQSAVENALSIHPDAILMDIRLPGDMDGIQAAELIRAAEDIPIIFVTGYSTPETVARARAVAAAAVLAKPVSVEEIDAALRAALEGPE